jgi:putative transposase
MRPEWPAANGKDYSQEPNIYYLCATVLVMPRPEQIPIQKHITQEELQKRIKTLETNTKILQRLYFIKHRYDGESVEEASRLVGAAKPVGYEWQKRWNESGYSGLIPKYAGGRPSKLSDQQKEKLQLLLKERDAWTTEDVRLLILNEFDVDYTLKQVRIIAKRFGMNYAKPFTFDYRKPPNAEQNLKKLTED